MARILVVEDDPDIRELVALRLTLGGHAVMAATDGLEAVEQWRAEAYDVLVTDVSMPGMSGIDLVRWVRARGDDPPVPIVVVSALSHPRDQQRAHDAGADVYVTKPFSIIKLLATIDELLGA